MKELLHQSLLNQMTTETIQQFQLRCSLTQTELAKMFNIDQPHVSRMIKTNQYLIINSNTLVKIIKEI